MDNKEFSILMLANAIGPAIMLFGFQAMWGYLMDDDEDENGEYKFGIGHLTALSLQAAFGGVPAIRQIMAPMTYGDYEDAGRVGPFSFTTHLAIVETEMTENWDYMDPYKVAGASFKITELLITGTGFSNIGKNIGKASSAVEGWMK